jgi:hypothetical protein
MNQAQEKYDKAEECFTAEWKKDNGEVLTRKYYQQMKEELKELFENLQSKEEIYKELLKQQPQQGIIVTETSFGKFKAIHPASFPLDFLDILEKINNLLDKETFTKSFGLRLKHNELIEIISEKLKVKFVSSKDYNDGIIPLREIHGEDVCCTGELGWFDCRVSTTTIYINYDYYGIVEGNLQWLRMLIFITIAHELCHFLVYHTGTESPTHNAFGEQKIESGECWELKNLGGIVNHAARNESPFVVEWLHINRGSGGKYLATASIENMEKLAMGNEMVFPVTLSTIDGEIEGLQKYKHDRHCVESSKDRPFIQYKGPKLVMHEKMPDKKGRYFQL